METTEPIEEYGPTLADLVATDALETEQILEKILGIPKEALEAIQSN